MTMSSTISLTLAKRSASERSELAGAEERWRERFTRKSVDFRERAAAVFRFGRRVCGRRSRTLSRGPGSCGAGRLRTARTAGSIFPFRTPWRRGFRGVWSAAGASAPDHGTRTRRPCCRRTVAVWTVMGVADGEERPQAAERRAALSSLRRAE